jgi:hypothetical protein
MTCRRSKEQSGNDNVTGWSNQHKGNQRRRARIGYNARAVLARVTTANPWPDALWGKLDSITRAKRDIHKGWGCRHKESLAGSGQTVGCGVRVSRLGCNIFWKTRVIQSITMRRNSIWPLGERAHVATSQRKNLWQSKLITER